MLSEQSKEHCMSIGLDKHGLTNCHKCPGVIRSACTGRSYQGWDGLLQWQERVNLAVSKHYQTGVSDAE
jgi:hypothetical protein